MVQVTLRHALIGACIIGLVLVVTSFGAPEDTVPPVVKKKDKEIRPHSEQAPVSVPSAPAVGVGLTESDFVASLAAERRKHKNADYYELQGTAGKLPPPQHSRPWNAPVETPLARAIRETGSIKNARGKRSLLSEHYAKGECRWVFTKYNESPFEKAWADASTSFVGKEVTVGFAKFRKEFDHVLHDMETKGAAWFTRHQLPTSAASNIYAGSKTAPISEAAAAAFRRETAPREFAKHLPAGGHKIPEPASPAAPVTADVDAPHPLCQDGPLTGPDPKIYPTMAYRLECPAGFPFEKVHPDVARKYKPGSEVEVPIEPLAGILRSPKAMLKDSIIRHLGDRDYMMVDSWSLLKNVPLTIRAAQPRVIFMDMGARGWQTSILSGVAGHNQAWFEWTYRERCVNFDVHVGIEKENYDQHTFWNDKSKAVPGWMQSRYQWLNRGAEFDPASWANPWNFILSETTENDIVLVKLDIDTAAVEGPLIEQLAQMPEVMKRIDEFYFEYHVHAEHIGGIWGGTIGDTKANNIDSIAFFKKLRENGVASHSWI